MKNQKGITLIALVVTIIVLLILAGISIAMLTGDNGVITRTNTAKVSQIEGQVKEEVKLAVQSAKIYAMQKSVETSGGGWFAAEADELETVVTEMTKVDLTRSDDGTDATKQNGYAVQQNPTTGTKAAAKASLTITYTSPAYKEATNYTSAKIEATVGVEGNDFVLGTNWIKHFRTADETTAEGVGY